MGINRDRVSDIAANILKQYFIQYTQRQCALWRLPMRHNVPLEHFFDANAGTWADGNFDLPVSPIDGSPILLVPRRIVRAFPWINYTDFLRSEFAALHRPTRGRRAPKAFPDDEDQDKATVVALNRRHLERVDRYVAHKEAAVGQAQPGQDYIDAGGICPQSDKLKERFAMLLPGIKDAGTYQVLILETMNFLFSPELIDGEMEVRTVDGTERRDIIFTNDSDMPFWDYTRNEHSSLLMMIETKNTNAVKLAHVNQTATYLGDRVGRLGFIATRNPPSESVQRKLSSVYNDSNPRKIIIVLTDSDFGTMLSMKCAGQEPTKYVQRLYRRFRQTVQ